jgi:hypothetical protein
MVKKIIIIFCLLNIYLFAFSQPAVRIARVKYQGGGDWYNDRTILPNMMNKFEKETGMKTADEVVVTLDSYNIFSYPILFATGHGRIIFTDQEIKNLRNYLFNGGFFYIDDDYGMDVYFQEAIKTLFPERELVELPDDHILFNIYYDFPDGAPKIHDHYENLPSKTFAILDGERIMLLYTFNSNISDGWASPEVHGNTPEIRENAFRMGTNIIYYALTH